ncbi:hypothetical protein P280DRAFT_245947 [Massarina eburnea CBS 473.64]|uniref:Uncharacterized protein n=1 Tax=Massarina eburnea CBS 473.64 TaxID=1395130 RepID=A0A6A6SAI5_9PLEO|nr:hypothetical protein P280DRAFT_245947 [Massarina eburnea CBS 473.64]
MVLPLFYGADRNRHGSESAVPEFYEYSPSEDEISTSREANNARLRKAISYLADEGGDDDPSLYLDRVQQIDDYLKQYRSQGFAYDTKLYRNARAMIREIQRDVQLVAEEESSVDFGESDASVEVIPTEALYREEDDEDEMFSGVPGTPHQKQQHMPTPPDTSSRKVKSARTSQHTKSRRPTTPSQVDILEKVHLYGGPGNPKELWHRDFPAILPFGENLFMQEWESQKIHYDLTQSAKKKLGDKDAVVTTNVPYNFVSDKFLPRQFESGSRFKLPPLAAYQRLISDSKLEGFFPVQTAINEFNQGGIPKSQGRIQAENDYVPRIFLKQANNKLVAPFKRMSDKAKGKRALQDARSIGHPSGYSRQAGFSATSRNHAQSLDQSESKTAPGPSKTAKQSRVGTAGPGVQYHVRNVLEKSAKAQGSAPVYEDEWSDSYSSDFDFSSDEDFVPSGLNGHHNPIENTLQPRKHLANERDHSQGLVRERTVSRKS